MYLSSKTIGFSLLMIRIKLNSKDESAAVDE